MTTSTKLTAEYKGRRYRLAWEGPTKHGRRAKLQFWDGSKEFWVDSSAIRIMTRSEATRSASHSQASTEKLFKRRFGWDGVRGSASYYGSGMYDEES